MSGLSLNIANGSVYWQNTWIACVRIHELWTLCACCKGELIGKCHDHGVHGSVHVPLLHLHALTQFISLTSSVQQFQDISVLHLWIFHIHHHQVSVRLSICQFLTRCWSCCSPFHQCLGRHQIYLVHMVGRTVVLQYGWGPSVMSHSIRSGPLVTLRPTFLLTSVLSYLSRRGQRTVCMWCKY